MILYNSQTRQKEEFIPQKEGEVRMYVCGPTVYDDAHLGHARSGVAFDLLRRVLKACGYRVIFAKNYTDIDDKIITKAAQTGKSVQEVAGVYIAAYERDMAALGVKKADLTPMATQTLEEMTQLIENLIAKGCAYTLEGDVYFSVPADDSYGSLSGRVEDEEAQARVVDGKGKNDKRDFALWKGANEGVYYPSPFGNGRPGWHLECSAMIKKHLAYEGAYQIDIHGGGADLLFPHHENEVAQSRCGYDQELARYWVHNGFVTIDGEKMSKSLGNSFFVKDALNVYDGEILRFYLLCTHYRASLSYNDEDLSGSKKRLDRIYRLKKRLDGVEATMCDEGFTSSFLDALQDDLNISVALAVLDEYISKANDHLDAFPKDKAMKSVIMADMEFVAAILGVGGKTPLEYFQMGVNTEKKVMIEEMIEKRSVAKKEKDFAEADALRNELLTQGIALMDTPAGTQWEVVG